MRKPLITSIAWIPLALTICLSGGAAASDCVPSPPIAAVDGTWWAEAARCLEIREYAIGESPAGLQAPNRAQNLRTYFRPHGIEAVPRTGADDPEAWRFQWHTTAWGREGDLQPVGKPVQQFSDRRVAYVYSTQLSEWYENRPAGLKQGFTISARPGGEGTLVLSGRIAPSLTPHLSSDRQQINFADSDGTTVLCYGGLYVEDTRGEAVPSWLDLGEGTIRIVIDDSQAVYPIEIDPLLSNPSWQAEGDQVNAFFGFCVSTAGDVNGDGFSDVIVGAYSYDTGIPGQGAAFAFHGSATGLSPTPNWTTLGEQADAGHGYAVSTAGDIDADGYGDVIVGVPWHDTGLGEDGGVVRVYRGTASGLQTWPCFSHYSSNDANAGNSVATAGDVNGDGYDDIIFGSQRWRLGGDASEGKAHVYYGYEGGINTETSWSAEGGQEGAYFGRSVATAGDVNGDGYADVIIGAHLYDASMMDCGIARVFLGSASGPAASPVWTYYGNTTGARLGCSVATAGDVNGDGYADIVVGASHDYDSIFEQFEGMAYVFRGSSSGPSTTPWWIGEGEQGDAHYGICVAPAGDVDGDGFADVIVGARYYDNGQDSEGKAWVYHGSAWGLTYGAAWSAEGNQAGAEFGRWVATAGDVNGDGFSDVLIGAWRYSNPESQEGAAFVYYGSGGGLTEYSDWTESVEQHNARFGTGVGTAGDVNGDGFSDVIIGAPSYDGLSANSGAAFLYEGTDQGLSQDPVWTVEGEGEYFYFGYVVAGVGDLNGDGFTEVMVGAGLYEGGLGAHQGKVYLYYGSASWPSSSPEWTFTGELAEAYTGMSISSAGDVNGDGYGDVIFNARDYDDPYADAGKVYVFYGSETGIASSPDWTKTGSFENERFGYSVSTAGDVNGDGFSDVIIGASATEAPGGSPGFAYVYHGSETGLGTTPDWSGSLGQIDDGYGMCVSTTGDVNGDGFDDVIVGAPYYDRDGYPENTGAVSVYLGSAGGVEPDLHWFVWTDQELAIMGLAVSTVGDVNGDGFSDIAMSAPRYDYPHNDEGLVWVKLGSADGIVGFPEWFRLGGQPNAWFGNVLGTAGDVNGDGFDDLLVGAENYDAYGFSGSGAAFVYPGNLRHIENPGLPLLPHQRRTDRTMMDRLAASDSEDSFRLLVNGRSAAGRCRVRMAGNIAEMDTDIADGEQGTGDWIDTGSPSAHGSVVSLDKPVEQLTAETSYRWRMRIESNSPYFPHTPWMSLAASVPSQKQMRTAGGSSAVETESAATMTGLRIESVRPNPFTPRTAIVYALPSDGLVKLAVYDPAGRLVMKLADEEQIAGRHVASWDGRDATGVLLRSGVYFGRLEFDGEVQTTKLILTR